MLAYDTAPLHRQREYDMEVWHGQQFGVSSPQPSLGITTVALGATAIATGVIGVDLLTAATT
jgi:hypothetical protein